MSTSEKREPLTQADVVKVANLAMLDLTPQESSVFSQQLNAILDRVAEMNALDLDGVEPTAHPHPLVNVYRSDQAEQNVDVTANALAVAPEVEDQQFKVPPALGEQP